MKLLQLTVVPHMRSSCGLYHCGSPGNAGHAMAYTLSDQLNSAMLTCTSKFEQENPSKHSIEQAMTCQQNFGASFRSWDLRVYHHRDMGPPRFRCATPKPFANVSSVNILIYGRFQIPVGSA